MKSMNLTIAGWIATEPVMEETPAGEKALVFKVAYMDETTNMLDARTEWIKVRVFGPGAEYGQESLRKGQPVVVCGRIYTKSPDNAPAGYIAGLFMDAEAIGHNIMKGTSKFSRGTHD